MSATKLCVTGGAGFIGSAFVHRLLSVSSSVRVVVLDSLTYAGNLENLAPVERDPRFEFVHASVNDADAVATAIAGCDVVVNFAAESHVDRSVADASEFIATNVDGTRVLLDAVVGSGRRFVQVSTDEVYGSIEGTERFTETSPLAPSSPYAASKAAADLLVGAYAVTHGIDAVITRCGNNYGPRQFPEKLVPLFIANAMADRELPLYGDGENVRDWIWVGDHVSAIHAAMERGESGRVYNVSSNEERTNKQICERLLSLLDKPWSLVRFVTDRPGHDRRYALSAERLREELGWRPEMSFDDGLAATVEWYRENDAWSRRVLSGEYREYYRRQYGERLGQ